MKGLSAVTLNAHSTEVASCSFDEQQRVLAIAQDEVGGRLPIVNGVWADGSLEAARIARAAQDGGASALLVFPPAPFTLQQSPEMAVEHFRRIADASDLPIIVFQYPLATGQGYPNDTMLKMIEQKESGGRRYDKEGRLLTSPKGAQGEMQVMPSTARNPGFGIRPAKEGDAEDLARVGRDFYTKMLERYGDPKVAAIAYNMGPGATDKWLMAGADPARLPDETRRYAQGFAKGGIAHFQSGGDTLLDDKGSWQWLIESLSGYKRSDE